MAKKIQVKQILELRAAGLSQNNIAKSRHMSKRSVNDVFQIAQGLNVSYESIKDMRPEEVYRLDRDLLLELSTCQFVHNYSNIIFQGFTGSGKSFFACSIGRQACKQSIRTRYIRIPDLLMERDEAAEEKMGIGRLLAKYSNYKLLLLDEWLLNDYSDEELHFLFELIERRYDAASTIFCTQYKAEDWHGRLGGGVLADSIMDRIIYKSFQLYAGDINMREFFAKRS